MRTLTILLLLMLTSAGWSEEPETVRLKGKDYSLKAFLWRDFMPSLDRSGGSPLMASLELVNEGRPLAGLKWESMQAFHDGKEVWKTQLESRDNSAAAYGGPDLAVGSTVDLLVQFKDETGKSYKLWAHKVAINRTD